jgi:dTDP-4-dehydrorhamnose reductase
MKIFITGGSGMIGSKFVSDLGSKKNEVLYTFLSRNPPIEGGKPISLDVSDREKVISIIQDFNPDLIIHCSALTKVDLCETDQELANKINVQGTQNIADAAKKTGSKLIYISTSFVFDGEKKIYHEDDKPNPVDHYGVTKLKGEEITKKSGQPFLILRTDHPYRWSLPHLEKNNIMRLVGCFEKGEKTREGVDWYNTPTLVDNLVEASMKLIKKWEDGIYQVVGPDFISRYDLAMKVADIVGGDKSLIVKAKMADFNLPAKRPNVHMSNEKLEKKTGFKMFGVEKGVRFLLEQRAKSK